MPGAGRLRAGGFTLLEVMLVLIIIGIVTGMAVLALDSGVSEPPVEAEGQRLAALLQLHRETAILRREQRGLRVSSDGYQFMSYRDGEWQPLENGSLVNYRKLPEELQLRLQLADSEPDGEFFGAEDGPQIWLSSTGAGLPFELELRSRAGGARWVIEGDSYGDLQSVLHLD